MPTPEIVEIENSINRISKVSRTIFILCNIATMLVIIVAIAAICYRVIASFQNANGFSSRDILSIVSASITFAWIVVFIQSVARIFADALRGCPPFSVKQIKRVRFLSYLVLAFAALETLFSFGDAVLFNDFGNHVTMVQTTAVSGSSIKINCGAIFMAIILYCLSIFFEYGTLLQRLSDETG